MPPMLKNVWQGGGDRGWCSGLSEAPQCLPWKALLGADLLPPPALGKWVTASRRSPEVCLHIFGFLEEKLGCVWWHMPAIPALGRPRQEHCYEFEALLGFTAQTVWGVSVCLSVLSVPLSLIYTHTLLLYSPPPLSAPPSVPICPQVDSNQPLNLILPRYLNIYEQESCSQPDKIFMCFHGASVSI